MRVSVTKNGLTVRVIAGSRNAIIAMDLEPRARAGCLGFSIHRTDLGPAEKPFPKAKQETRWLPNMLRFASDRSDPDKNPPTTESSPLQKFRWGDYTLKPGSVYRYRVVPRYGKPGKLTPADPLADAGGVEVEVTTEDPRKPATAVFFNRGAAASRAFELKFPNVKTLDTDSTAPDVVAARQWLSNGLEEAILDFMKQAADSSFALHGAIYEFQKHELLQGLKDAAARGAEVRIVYHHRRKGDDDRTAKENDEAIDAVGIRALVKARDADPQGAIMHDKFLVLLKKTGRKLVPVAVWTGSTNWTDGGIYGQLNVGHAVYDADVAGKYEQLFQLLHADSPAKELKQALATLSPVKPRGPVEHGVTPVFSPQSGEDMLKLYASLVEGAQVLLVSAPFELSPIIRKVLNSKRSDALRLMLLDKEGSLGKPEEVSVVKGDPSNALGVATTLKSPLHDFQGKVLEGKMEGFRHKGIHIHSKIIAVDPFGSDPVIVTGSANFSKNSTTVNDSNTLVIRGDTQVADIYSTEFMRMYEHYHFRAKRAEAAEADRPLGLSDTDAWSAKYYVKGSPEEKDRRLFAGTH